MPATPNILLQNAAQAKAQAASAKTSAMAVDTGDKASSFAKVFADQGSGKPVASTDNSPKPSRDKVADNSGKKISARISLPLHNRQLPTAATTCLPIKP